MNSLDLKNQIYNLMLEHYCELGCNTYLGMSEAQRYKEIAYQCNELLTKIWELVKE